jgi:hypothetical protein
LFIDIKSSAGPRFREIVGGARRGRSAQAEPAEARLGDERRHRRSR